jgi:hypothetical protein
MMGKEGKRENFIHKAAARNLWKVKLYALVLKQTSSNLLHVFVCGWGSTTGLGERYEVKLLLLVLRREGRTTIQPSN